MTNLTKVLIGAGIVGAGVIATPVVYNSQINKFIAQEQNNLKAQQIELKQTQNNDSFFNAKREYIVTIKDISPIIESTYPNINNYDLQNLKEIFNNTKFLVTLNMLKFPIYHKDAIKIDLDSLNNTLTKSLSNDKTGKQLLEAIKNRVFEAILDINNLKISKAKLKDIDLTLDNSTNYRVEKFNLKIKNAISDIENNNLKISKTAINYTKQDKDNNYKKTTDFIINNVDEKIKQQDLLNYSSTLKIDSINFSQKSTYSNINLNINNISNSSSVKTIADKTSLNNKIDINSASLNADKDSIKVDKLVYNFNMSNLDSPSLKQIIDMANSNNLNDTEKLSQNFNQLIQKGFKVSISPLSINGIKAQFDNQSFDIKPIEINFDATLLQNNYTLQSNNPAYLSTKINAKLKAQTSPNNIDLLNKINPQVGMMMKLISKEVNNKILINLEYQNGKVTSNGKPIIQ